MNNNELLLKTLFCCSACDGEIAPEELALVKELASKETLFSGINVEETLNQFVDEINKAGQAFLLSCINELASADLNNEEQLNTIRLSINMIEADEQVLYSEVSFFKKLRNALPISDEEILATMPDVEEYLLQDIMAEGKTDDWNAISFSSITFDSLK